MHAHKVICSFAVLAGAGTLLVAPSLTGDEGMWTFDNPPLKQLREKYNFTPTEQWLDHIRLSSVRLNDGGSGSFISPHGLLLTNHHVARGQLQKNSSAEHDYIHDGFYAADPAQEMKSPDLEVNVLVSMENVTPQVMQAVQAAKTPEEQFAARKAKIAQIERESQQKTGFRSDVVALYQGGEYWLYRYRKYTDVRLVFAPEEQTAFFGGDPDNFTYPRYDLDMALFRVYDNGKPIDSKDYLKWNPAGAAEDELVFVSGHPGATSRLDTMAQLAFLRDIGLPNALKSLHNRVEALERYSARGAEQARQAASLIFFLQNSVKADDGVERGLVDARTIAKKQAEENEFKAAVMANPEWAKEFGGAWDAIAGAETKAATRAAERFYHALDSQLAGLAQTIVQYVAEIHKPDGERLPGYHESELDSLKLRLFSPAPIYPALEIARMTAALELDLAEAGKDDAFLKAILKGRTPGDAAAALANGTKLADPAVRHKLVDGGEAAVAASGDPMIVLARELDPARREFIHWQEDNIESVEQRAAFCWPSV